MLYDGIWASKLSGFIDFLPLFWMQRAFDQNFISSQICSTKDGLPLANIWDVNHWIALRRQERFAEMFGQENTSKLKSSSTQNSEPLTYPGPSILEKAKRVGFK